jgi:hypothetical protein
MRCITSSVAVVVSGATTYEISLSFAVIVILVFIAVASEA